MKTIDDALSIATTLQTVKVGLGNVWRADATALPGTPPCGQGSTEAEAKYDLLAKLAFSRVTEAGKGYGPIIDSLCKEAL